MERIVKIHVQKLPEGVYLATSEDVQGLIGRGNQFFALMPRGAA